MQYRLNSKNGDKISLQGFGCMRFPQVQVVNEEGKSVSTGNSDIELTTEIIKKAIELGVNFFDTAYVYGDSEAVIGKIIEKLQVRDKIFLSTKMPAFACKSGEDFEKFFSEQLKRLRVKNVDYLFVHNLTQKSRWDELKSWGILEWLAEKKAAGQTFNVGFSSHGSFTEFKAILDDYDWDFTMLQYNYLDEHWQAGVEGVEYVGKKGIPLFIMEPVRGGMLAKNLPVTAKEIFDGLEPKRSYAARAMRFVMNRPEVTLVLSGMNTLEQVIENCGVADETFPNDIKGEEKAAYEKAVFEIKKTLDVPCTACGYCLPCPKGVMIPDCFYYLNVSNLVSLEQAKIDFGNFVGYGNVNSCVGCRLCEKHCPQNIKIAENLKKVCKRFSLGAM